MSFPPLLACVNDVFTVKNNDGIEMHLASIPVSVGNEELATL